MNIVKDFSILGSASRIASKTRRAAKAPVNVSDPELNADLARRARTEMGNSERLVARFGSQAHYVCKWDKWVVWDGARWVLDTKDARVLRLAKDAARLIIAEAATFHDKDKQQAHFKWAMKSQKRSVVSASIYLARPDVMIQHETLDQNNDPQKG